MRTGWIVALVTLSLTAAALAQQDEPAGGRPGRPGAGQARGPGGGMGAPLEVAQRLVEILQLTDEQKPKFDAVVEKFKPKFEQLGTAAKTQELLTQMRDARQAGDDAKLAELRQKLDEVREATRPLMNEFYAEVEPLLTPAQQAQLRDYRDRLDRGRGGPDGLMRRLPDELKLTPEQRTKYDKIVADYRAQQQALAPLERELQTARRENNADRVKELEQQLQAKRGADDGVAKFLDQVETLLTDEQKAKLPELWARLTSGGPEDVRAVLQAANRLNLDPEQQKKLREITRAALHTSRGELTAEKRAELAKSVKAQVIALLTAPQVEELEKSLQRSQRPARGDRGGAGNPPGEGQPPRPDRGGTPPRP